MAWLVAAVLIALAHCARAEGVVPGPGAECQAAITAAERDLGIPDRLLAAIGRAESGRPDPVTGGVTAWPWTIDANGQGRYFATAEEAIGAVRALQAQGVRSIDVGCVQVNLAQHPQAFASLQEAFDPAANARYGARFLRGLFASTRRWDLAVAYYHSRTRDIGGPYAQRVLGAAAIGLAGETAPTRQMMLHRMAEAWRATLAAKPAHPTLLASAALTSRVRTRGNAPAIAARPDDGIRPARVSCIGCEAGHRQIN